MGDLSRFAIDELTPQEKHEVFKILEDLRRSGSRLLHFLLHRGPVSAGPQWYGPVRRMRETPAQRHETGRDGARGEARYPAHNPKVAGSNPAPATN